MYQGLTPTILRQGANQSIRFYCIMALEDLYRDGDHNISVPTPVVGAFGAIAGAASVLGNTPIDVVKTRMQGHGAHRYRHTWDCIVKIWSEEGPLAFYKGMLPRLVRVGMGVAISFMLYERFMNIFNNIWP